MEDVEQNSRAQFNQWATWYDGGFSYRHFWAANYKVMKLLDPKERSRMLDIGCGTGILLEQLHNLRRRLTLCGIDIAPLMIVKAKAKLGKNATLQVGSGNKLPFRNNSFDYITCCTSLHHHPNTLKSLTEMYRALKPSGKVIVLDIYVDGLLRWLGYKFDNLIFREGKTFAYTQKQMYELFQKSGFTNIWQQPHGYFKLITIGEKH